MPNVKVLLTRLDPDLPPPSYARSGDAGADLVTTSDVLLQPGERALVGTGVALALPEGYAGFVHPRSGLAARAGLGVVNAPGTVDAGYRGEIRVCLINHDRAEPLSLRRGDRIAQLVLERYREALAGDARMNCDLCVYRHPLPGYEHRHHHGEEVIHIGDNR